MVCKRLLNSIYASKIKAKNTFFNLSSEKSVVYKYSTRYLLKDS